MDQVGHVWAEHRPQVVATLARRLGDLQLAEDAVQEAYLAAARRWPTDGLPDRPGAWLTTTAWRKAVDVQRQQRFPLLNGEERAGVDPGTGGEQFPGRVAAAALLERDRVPGGTIEIAGDELTGQQIAAVYGQHFGLPARFDPLPLDVLEQDPDRQAMFAWFNHLPSYEADFSSTKDLAPAVKSLTTWLESQD